MVGGSETALETRRLKAALRDCGLKSAFLLEMCVELIKNCEAVFC